ncbi:uncharacterized protein LOC126907534 [Daktulosphaira vitifoliae]|uniref:uncharacterized protein LOC126907534 n=1 Tax=Daktulosphaira vitifoliae TaxID=58002 RepID=UPI0021A9F7D8|nr:uncharacterized protein LOC126907534 [Daktulosphaira vitifoliae]
MYSIPKYYYDFIRKRMLIWSINQLQKADITEDNFNDICHLAAEEVNKIASFVLGLKKYKYCFEFANKYIPTDYVDKRTFNCIIKYNIPFDQLRKYEDIYQTLYFPGVNTSNIKKYYSHSSNDENNEMNNDENKVFNNGTQSYYTPKYLVDYLLYD